jgi:hypothetical protein
MAGAEAALAAYLVKTYPNLRTDDIIRLVASGLTGADIDKYLASLCGGLEGIAQLVIDAHSGNAHAQSLLKRLIQFGKDGKKGDAGSQRIMGLLNIFGMDHVEDVEVPIPDPANPGADAKQSRRADIVLKGGIAIEVGGSSKAMDQGQNFKDQIKALIGIYGADKVEVYLEEKRPSSSGSGIGRAKTYAIDTLADALGSDREKAERQVTTFKPSDRLCVS